jgi:hypothetical protein
MRIPLLLIVIVTQRGFWTRKVDSLTVTLYSMSPQPTTFNFTLNHQVGGRFFDCYIVLNRMNSTAYYSFIAEGRFFDCYIVLNRLNSTAYYSFIVDSNCNSTTAYYVQLHTWSFRDATLEVDSLTVTLYWISWIPQPTTINFTLNQLNSTAYYVQLHTWPFRDTEFHTLCWNIWRFSYQAQKGLIWVQSTH